MPPVRRSVTRRRSRLPPVAREQATAPVDHSAVPALPTAAEIGAASAGLLPTDLALSISGLRGHGSALPEDVRGAFEERLGVGLAAIRIHAGADADRVTGALGAVAFSLGSDLFFSSGSYAPGDPAGRRLLAHEVAHALQPAPAAAGGTTDAVEGAAVWLSTDEDAEAEADRVVERVTADRPDTDPSPEVLGLVVRMPSTPRDVLQLYPDPTRTPYTAAIVTPLRNEDLQAAVADLRRAFVRAGPEDPTTLLLWNNLDLVLAQARQRHLAVGDNEAPPIAAKPDQLAAPGSIAALDVHYEALDAQVQKQLGPSAAALRARITERRGWLKTLHRDAVLPEGARIEALEVALITWQQSRAVVPTKPTGDTRIAAVEQNLRRALDLSAATLLSTAQQDGIVALELARTDYLAGFARLLFTTANDLKASLRDPRLRKIPLVSNYEEGINTRTPGGPWEGGDDVREYRESLGRLTAELDARGDLAARAAATPAERLSYLMEHGDELMSLVGQVQAVLVAGQGIALVAYFQEASSSRVIFSDHIRINDMRREIIEPMISALRMGRSPDPSAIEAAQYHLETASPEPTDKEGNADTDAIEKQRERHRQYRAGHGMSVDQPEDPTRRRLKEMARFDHDFGIFVGVVASIIGTVAAAGAVGAVMRTAAFSEGGAFAAGQGGLRVAAVRFAVQSLTFTFASQTMQTALYGRLPKATDVAKAAAMDAMTLGFMQYIGLPFTKVGQQPPTLVQFRALWLWSSAWQLGGLALKGQLTVSSGLWAVAMGGVETALMLKAMEIAHRIGVLPTPDGLGNWYRPRTPEQYSALQAYLAAQQKGRAVREDAIAWERGERRPEGLDQILEQSQAFMGAYRKSLAGMETTGLLAKAEIAPIMERAIEQATEIQNLRDAVRLGFAPGGPNLVRYSGTVQNLLVYLQRLRTQGLITGAAAVGRGGVIEVTYADGTVRHFYPQGAGGTAAAPDLLLESVQRAMPAALPGQHLTVLQSLRRLPADTSARLAAAAENSPHASTVLGFIARPDVAIELRRPNSLYSEQLLTAALTGDPAALRLLERTESPLTLQRWFQTEFEKMDPSGGRSLPGFFRFVDAVRLYRGTLDVGSLGEATEVTRALSEADAVSRFRPAARSNTPQASISAPGPRAPSIPTPTPEDFFLRQGFTNEILRFDAWGLQWFVTVDGSGRPVRAWVFKPNTDAPLGQFDVAGVLARLREGVRQLDALGPGQDPQARALVDSLITDAKGLIFLRRMRGYDIAAELALLDRIELDARGSNPRARPPTIDVAGPLTPPATGPGALLDPVTPSEILSQRQRGLQSRAGRMGRLADAPVQVGLSALIRGPLTLTEQAAVRTALERAEQHLDQLAESAYAEVSGRMGPRRFAPVLANVFAGRTRLQIGEALRYMTEQPGYADTALEGLARLRPTDRVMLGQLEPALLAALGEIAATNQAAASRMLEDHGRLLLELQRNPGMAARFIELAHMLQGGELPFADPHRHIFGGIFYPKLLVQAMVETTSLTPPGGAEGPRLVRTRLAALTTARDRLLRAGDKIGERLPIGHPGTDAYVAQWQIARPLVEQYGELLADSIRRGQCLVGQGPLEAQLTETLTRAFTLPAETAARGPQGDAFFILFAQLSRAAPTRGVVPAVSELAAAQRVAYVELRAGPDQTILQQLRAQGVIGADGRPLPDLRLVISVPRGRLTAAEVERTLSGLDPAVRSRVAGIDLSGVESVPLPAGELIRTNGAIAKMNFTSLATMFAANPALIADVSARLGMDPVAAGRALTTQIDTGTAPAAGAPHPVAELARLNRRVQELVSEFDARDNTTRLPNTLLGTTIHAGEQVRSDARIDMLLNDMQTALNAGADRISHGIVLGFPLPHGLAQLGFIAQPDGSWSRPTAGGRPPESYTPAQIAGMEHQRLELIRRVGDERVTLEVSPTSNIVLAGFPAAAHPLAQLLQTRPNLRVAISTDNPALHLADPARELAIASAVSGATHPQIVRIYLEGFSSRLGARGMGNAPTIRRQVRDALVVATPAAERPYVLFELQSRYGIDPGVTSGAPIDAAVFEARLNPYLERAIR